MTPKLRKEVLTVFNAAVVAEREACAKIAEMDGATGRLIAKRIRMRQCFRLPPLAFEERAE